MLLAMDNKTSLIEMELAACFVAFAIVAFTLMLGNTLWKSVAGKSPFKMSPIDEN
jgi:hypothetical protein